MEKPPVPDAVGIRAQEGRRIEALVCRPFRAGRVLAGMYRWFLRRLISSGASGAEDHFLESSIFYPLPSRIVKTRKTLFRTAKPCGPARHSRRQPDLYFGLLRQALATRLPINQFQQETGTVQGAVATWLIAMRQVAIAPGTVSKSRNRETVSH